MTVTPNQTALRLSVSHDSPAYRYHQLIHRGAVHQEAHGTVCSEFGVAFHDRTPYVWRRRLSALAERVGAIPAGSGAARERYREALRALFG